MVDSSRIPRGAIALFCKCRGFKLRASRILHLDGKVTDISDFLGMKTTIIARSSINDEISSQVRHIKPDMKGIYIYIYIYTEIEYYIIPYKTIAFSRECVLNSENVRDIDNLRLITFSNF